MTCGVFLSDAVFVLRGFVAVQFDYAVASASDDGFARNVQLLVRGKIEASAKTGENIEFTHLHFIICYTQYISRTRKLYPSIVIIDSAIFSSKRFSFRSSQTFSEIVLTTDYARMI